eukprot:gnl/TRDRNA2_/TRDRNA2_159263_c0_seq2.p1 gnl/TRDRNA2_/TRDRNA2_159263_c0~~gnl/TRDRNA2_/TRDRNA2_159263_c0_seq2.p1  ORF type:complete len:427 (-),score=64.16 gnl/TRDRNA2_/TRDRNA2_159263_c0_seq2:46-1326(-)
MGIFGCALEKLAWVRAESPFVCGGDSEGVAPRPARVASWATHRLPVALERVLLLLDELEHAVNELPGAKCQLRVLLQDLEMLAIQPAADAAAPHCDGEKLLRLRMLDVLIVILACHQVKDAEALRAAFNATNALLDGPCSVRAELLKHCRLGELVDRSNRLGIRDEADTIEDFEHVFPQLYFTTSVFTSVVRGHMLCVEKLAMLCMEAAGCSQATHVLDFGCGPGTWTLPLIRALGKQATVTCVDADRTAVGVTEHLAAKEGLSAQVRLAHVSPDFQELDRFLDGRFFDVLFVCDIARYLTYAVRELWPWPHEAFYRAHAGYWRRIRSHLRGSRTGIHMVSLEKPDLAEAMRGVLKCVGFREVGNELEHLRAELNQMWPPHTLTFWTRADAADCGLCESRSIGELPLDASELPSPLAALPAAHCLP